MPHQYDVALFVSYPRSLAAEPGEVLQELEISKDGAFSLGEGPFSDGRGGAFGKSAGGQ